jgi:hypothetical protein
MFLVIMTVLNFKKLNAELVRLCYIPTCRYLFGWHRIWLVFMQLLEGTIASHYTDSSEYVAWSRGQCSLCVNTELFDCGKEVDIPPVLKNKSLLLMTSNCSLPIEGHITRLPPTQNEKFCFSCFLLCIPRIFDNSGEANGTEWCCNHSPG